MARLGRDPPGLLRQRVLVILPHCGMLPSNLNLTTQPNPGVLDSSTSTPQAPMGRTPQRLRRRSLRSLQCLWACCLLLLAAAVTSSWAVSQVSPAPPWQPEEHCPHQAGLVGTSAALDLDRMPLAQFIRSSHEDFLRRQQRLHRHPHRPALSPPHSQTRPPPPDQAPPPAADATIPVAPELGASAADGIDGAHHVPLLNRAPSPHASEFLGSRDLVGLPAHPDSPFVLVLIYVDPGCGYSLRFLPTFDLLSLAFRRIQFVKFNAAYEHRSILGQGSSSLAVVRGFPSLYLFDRAGMSVQHIDVPERTFYTIGARLTNLTGTSPQPLPFGLGNMGWPSWPAELDRCGLDPLRELYFVEGGPMDPDHLPQRWDVWLSLIVAVLWITGSLLGVGQNEEADPEDPVPQDPDG